MARKKAGNVLNDDLINAVKQQNIAATLSMPMGKKKPQKGK